MFLLSKLLPLFVLPLGVSLMLILWGLVRRRRGFVWAGVVVLLISSNPFVGRYAMRSAEGFAERRPVADVVPADAIVVLSAGRVVAPGPDGVSEWIDANRFFGGVELFAAGKAPVLVFTGASLPWDWEVASEGHVLRDHAERVGVPRDRIVVTDVVTNTADEAREVRTVLAPRLSGPPTVVLVTSAFHMPRAAGLFTAAGMVVDPFPVSFWFSVDRQMTVLDFVPSVSALSQTHTALRELYGRAFYWLRSRLR
ncbi:MAG: YdcF family protein [Acidobacteria bacterium]|nr:YdcF family protein [Acidobacteriota bacterium]